MSLLVLRGDLQVISGRLNFLPRLETTISEIDWLNNVSAINHEPVFSCTG